jgi:hypothetical protein
LAAWAWPIFFSQLFWKLPPHFGCPTGNSFAFTTVSADSHLARTSGLCDWLGIESIYSTRERSFFVTDFNNDGVPEIGSSLSWLVRLNGLFVEKIVMPNLSWFGWLIWLAEAFISFSMFFGIFSRLGALMSLGISLQLMLGLAGVWDPASDLQEWEWAYHMIILFSIVMLGVAPGCILGLDAVLRPWLIAATQKGGRLARLLLLLLDRSDKPGKLT